MKLSKVLHLVSVLSGIVGIGTFAGAIIIGGNNLDNLVFGVSKMDALLCAGLLLLVAIWTGVGAMHHMMLEKRGELV